MLAQTMANEWTNILVLDRFSAGARAGGGRGYGGAVCSPISVHCIGSWKHVVLSLDDLLLFSTGDLALFLLHCAAQTMWLATARPGAAALACVGDGGSGGSGSSCKLNIVRGYLAEFANSPAVCAFSVCLCVSLCMSSALPSAKCARSSYEGIYHVSTAD